MNPLEQKLQELEKMISDIRTSQDIAFGETLKRTYLNEVVSAGVIDNPTSEENTSTVVLSGGGTVNHPALYDKRVRVEIDGSFYYLGLYNE